MKKNYSMPKLSVHGSIEELTQQRIKKFGTNDGILLTIPVPGDPNNTVPIGSL